MHHPRLQLTLRLWYARYSARIHMARGRQASNVKVRLPSLEPKKGEADIGEDEAASSLFRALKRRTGSSWPLI